MQLDFLVCDQVLLVKGLQGTTAILPRWAAEPACLGALPNPAAALLSYPMGFQPAQPDNAFR